jgi:hypothetical protein
MRRIAKGAPGESEAKIFYKQGKFMEDFEDDFDYQGQFARYFPTYQTMDDHQLRGYFSWRTKVRRGVIERTQLSFAFVYIYELLNLVGVNSPEEGFYKLKSFRTDYGKIDYKISDYVNLWIRDYVVYNNLDKSLLEDFSNFSLDKAVLVLLDHKAYDANAVFLALNSLSSYDLEKSRLFREHPEDVKNVVYDVFSTLAAHHGKKLCDGFFGRTNTSSYIMFKSAVFYHHTKQKDFVYEVNDVHKYRCENGSWSCERFFPQAGKRQQIGALLKNIDFFMRQKYSFRYALKADETTAETVRDMITGAIDRCLENKKQAALPKVEIDVSKLQNIRSAALETQSKLTVEEPEEEDVAETFNEKTEQENSAGLNDVERLFMNCLLHGKAYNDLVQSNGLMLSVLIDKINERLFDVFGDTVIVDDGGKPALIEDYVEALKGIIKE